MTKPVPKKSGRASPGKRLAALAPAAGKPGPRAKRPSTASTNAGASVTLGADVQVGGTIISVELPTLMKVRTKFVVVDKQELPVVVGGALETRFHVKLAAAYEARSIHNGLATEQGNPDNRVFGAGVPEAAIAMVIQSKAIADTFVTGRAFHVDFTEVMGG